MTAGLMYLPTPWRYAWGPWRPWGGYSRDCRADVLAHALAVCLGALAPLGGLAALGCALGGRRLQLCLPALLGDLWGPGGGGLERWPRWGSWDRNRLAAGTAVPPSPSSPERRPLHRGPRTRRWSQCGSPPGRGGGREQAPTQLRAQREDLCSGAQTLGRSVLGSLSTFSMAVSVSKPPTTLQQSNGAPENMPGAGTPAGRGRL